MHLQNYRCAQRKTRLAVTKRVCFSERSDTPRARRERLEHDYLNPKNILEMLSSQLQEVGSESPPCGTDDGNLDQGKTWQCPSCHDAMELSQQVACVCGYRVRYLCPKVHGFFAVLGLNRLVTVDTVVQAVVLSYSTVLARSYSCCFACFALGSIIPQRA